MTEDGDLGVRFYVPHEFGGAARDAEVDIAVLGQQAGDLGAGGYELQGCVRDGGRDESVAYDAGDGEEGVSGFFAT